MNDIIRLPEILLPSDRNENSMNKWSVIACDQFTSDKPYWNELDKAVGSAPSTLRVIFPEAYLKDEGGEERIKSIKATMENYLSSGVFEKLPEGMILTERATRYTKELRYGLVLSVDLESYSFAPKSNANIRATEATVPERIPPRVRIRAGAKIEAPHVMLLVDGQEEDIFGFIDKDKEQKVYDFELNQGGGHLRGWFLKRDTAEKVKENLYKTAHGEFLFAVGDGNHSLATAKTCWDNMKASLSKEERENHPARFALVEVVSIYSKALTFEPIHRFVEGVDAEEFISGMAAFVPFATERQGRVLTFKGDYDVATALRALDNYIAEYKAEKGGDVDYIHGKDELLGFVEKNEKSVGIMLRAIPKDGFFRSVEEGGSLPRKTFSMGEGAEKRYYTECKEI